MRNSSIKAHAGALNLYDMLRCIGIYRTLFICAPNHFREQFLYAYYLRISYRCCHLLYKLTFFWMPRRAYFWSPRPYPVFSSTDISVSCNLNPEAHLQHIRNFDHIQTGSFTWTTIPTICKQSNIKGKYCSCAKQISSISKI